MHELASLQATGELGGGFAAPDPWGDSLPDIAMAGDIGHAAWWARLPLSSSDESELAGDIRSLLVTQRLLRSMMPSTSAWLGAVTRVVVPLVRSQGGEFRSGSIAGIPGLVFVEMTRKQLLVLEALVHESAHLHFHIAEFNNDFIAAGHDGLYASPLRPDPRPLRGIFLALHALVYMCAFYKDWQRRTGDACATEARQDLLRHRDAAGAILRSARAHLSPAGDAYLTTCLDMAAADDLR
jgi:HEXXH motif-containing protein